jgi:antitoxin component YwqK of YwqJK toxin-antitoxin module
MQKFLAFIFLACFSLSVHAQKQLLVNSQEVMAQGMALYDSGKYDEAVRLYQTITPYDTNYVYMLTELALTYNAAEQYDKAIETALKVLEKPSYHRSHATRTLAVAYDKSGNFEKAVATFKAGIKEFPIDFLMRYNLAITYYNHKDYKLAEAAFIETLTLNPYHSGSHYYLGRLAALEGKKVRAMMALGVYLTINDEDNRTLVFLENLLNNEFEEEGSVTISPENAFQKLDQIVKAKVVMEPSFKPIIDVNAVMTRQYQLLFDQLPAASASSPDFWLRFYASFYQTLKTSNDYEPFMYHLLSSSGFQDVKKWNNKNEKRLSAYFQTANTWLSNVRATRTFPKEMGFDGPVSVWYGSGNKIEAIGNETNDKRQGKWMFFSDNSQLVGEGSYDKEGNRVGIWKSYHSNGRIQEIHNVSEGKIERYDEEGNLYQRYTLRDKKANGSVEFFYPCGILKEKLTYTDGKRNGPGNTYFINGKVEDAYTFKDDERDGSYKSYYDNGQLYTETIYAMGKAQGNFRMYYPDGKLMREGQYQNDKLTGVWKYYYPNGKTEKEGAFKDDLLSGEWKFYDNQGNLTEKQMYDDKGKITGENSIYHNGQLHYVFTYKNENVVSIVYYDKQGKVIGKAGSNDGSFSVKGYYPTGELRYEGSYKKGKANGEWKHYYRTGAVETVSTYANDELNGKRTDYFKTGEVKDITTYEDGKADGYSVEYYVNGKIKEEGWYSGGWRQQRWLTYYSNGELETDYYYLNGERNGLSLNYSPDGKIYSSINYAHDRMTNTIYYAPSGGKVIEKTFANPRDVFDQKFKNGVSQLKFDVACGEYASNIVRKFPNGKDMFINPLANGRANGTYQYFYPNGQVLAKGQMLNGDDVGVWKWFSDNGSLQSTGRYLAGQRDSVWTYYHPNGKVSVEASYQYNNRDGITRTYSYEGILIVEKMFDNKDLIAYRTTDKAGKLGDWVPFTSDAAIVAYFPNGKKALEEYYSKGLIDGKRYEYYQDGTILEYYEYKAGDFHGSYYVNYPNGKVREKGQYKFDELDGKLETYNENGTLRRTEEYVCGVRHGKSIQYENGVKKSELTFWSGIIAE